MEKVFSHAVGKFNDRQCLGTREILGEEKEVQPDGKVFAKFNLGEYKWRSYRDFGDQSEKFGRGLREIGVEAKQRVAMYAETRQSYNEDFGGALNKVFIIGLEPVSIVHYTRPGTCINRQLH